MQSSKSVCSCKVGTVADRWDLDDVHTEFETRWRIEGESVRELTDQFNCRVLRAGFERSDRTPIDGEIENLYRVLTDEEVDAGSRTQARERLRRNGVPIEGIEDGFVSHQTLYRHLRHCLGVEYEPDAGTTAERVDRWRDRIRALRARTATVTDRGMTQLTGRGAVDIGSFDVIVDINLICTDCGEFYDLEEVLETRQCGCATDSGEQ